MSRDRALSLLQQGKAGLTQRFGVTQLGLFGSTARDLARFGSCWLVLAVM
jgi:predicted nucleotidyltransferase